MNFIRSNFVFFLLALFPMFASGQPGVPVPRDRVAVRPDLRAMTVLRGQVPAWAAGVNDRGSVADNTPLQVTFVMARSPELQASFEQLLADQQNPNSASYHQWLTPQEVGERYGPTQHDVDALTNWLGSQGLAVTETAPSRMFLSVAGSAGVVARALGTNFHSFEANGEARTSAVADPSIPTAFSAVVGSIAGLTEADLQPMHKGEAVAERLVSGGAGVGPRYTTSTTTHYLAPSDFATIFDLKAIYSAGITGSGQKVAIIGRSRVAVSDITAFQSKTGNTTSVLNTVIPTTGVDPGVTGGGDQGEATLDVERVMGTAPGAQVDLVVSGSAGGFNGLYVAAQYEVQTLRDPVMNISFGSCEVFNGPSQVALWDAMFSQAASQGISVFVSSADSGAATCSTQFGAPQGYQFRSINYICASSYATCVGGTQLVDTANPATYWSSTNGTNLSSALSYIPEGAWNEPNSTSPYIVAGGGGGASLYVAKPVWQTGTGVPADGARDVPDVSFPSARHDGYYGCYAIGGGDCNNGFFEFFYGTSAAAPAMAGVAALLNQKMGGAQGNMNPLLYRLAASTPSAFHDATVASSGVGTCDVNVASLCNNTTPSLNSLSGGAVGFALTAGYDQATGLGSLDVNNFLNAAGAITKSTLTATTLGVTASASTITNTQTATFTARLTVTSAGTPSGTVQFYANNIRIGTAIAVVGNQAVSGALPFAAAGSYLITATYSGDSVFASTTAPGTALTVRGADVTVVITGTSFSVPVGTNASFTAKVTPASGATVPTGTMRFYAPDLSTDTYLAIAPLSGGSATTPAINFPRIGTYTLLAAYPGDTVYSPVNSSTTIITATKLPTLTRVSFSLPNIGVGGSKRLTASIGASITNNFSTSPTGTIQYLSNGVALSAPMSFSTAAIPPFASAGNYTITAVYSGDGNYLPSTSTGVPLTVVATPASYRADLAITSSTIAAGGPVSIALGMTSILGFAGTVNLSCSVAYNGPGMASIPATCALSDNSLLVDPDNGALTGLKVVTVAPHIATGAFSAGKGDRGLNPGRVRNAVLCAFVLLLMPFRRLPRRMLILLVAFGAGFGALSGCGGASGGKVAGTTPGTYTVTVQVTTTVAGIANPAPLTFTLTVQ